MEPVEDIVLLQLSSLTTSFLPMIADLDSHVNQKSYAESGARDENAHNLFLYNDLLNSLDIFSYSVVS